MDRRNREAVPFSSEAADLNPIRVVALASPEMTALERVEAVRVNDAQSLIREITDADVLVLAPRYGALLRDALPHARKLRWIHALGAGVETFPFDALRQSAIVVTNSRGIYADGLAEFTLAAMLWFAKDFRRLTTNQALRRWEPFPVERVEGKTLGIIGFGGTGRAIAKRAEPLGMHVLAVRRHGGTPIDDVIGGSDYVVISTPLTDATRGLVDARRIALMRPAAVLINISRGAVVDETSLVEALRAKRIRGAALDVFSVEPLPPDHGLWSLDNVLISPHSADRTADSHDRAVTFFLANLDRFQRAEPLENVVDLTAGY